MNPSQEMIAELAATEATCEYFERGLLRPDFDYETPPPYLESIVDAMDGDGNVILPHTPGLGFAFNWDYINENLIDSQLQQAPAPRVNRG